MSDRVARLLAALDRDDAHVHRAPGRVNLIGGHVDYHEGWVVPIAIDHDVLVASVPRADGRVVVRSLEFEGAVDVDAAGRDDPPHVSPRWGRTVAGVVRVLAERGRPPTGLDAVVTSTVPIGAGLSSSAAFEVALGLALDDAAGIDRPVLELARAAQAAEHVATGVPCGLQDQLASLCGRAGHALAIDCRTHAIEAVPLPADVAILVVHCGVPRTLEGSPWPQRRAEGEAVAAGLGLRVLRDATPEQVADSPRGRHVVSEIARVQEFAAALRDGRVDALGPLMLASHASLRDDMEVSTPELDALVDACMAEGALGARLTGGGFGGCVVALVPAEGADRLADGATTRYRTATGREPTPWLVAAADGAQRLA